MGPRPARHLRVREALKLLTLPLVLLSALSGIPRAQAEDTPSADIPASAPVYGMWLSEKHDGIFRIAPCGNAVCGTLIGLSYGPGEPMPTAKDGRSECNLVMLTGFRPLEDDPGRWGGKILDPDAGNLYHAQIWSPQPDILKLRGYILVPVFGETQTWSRYRGTIGPNCRMPPNL
nr:DUF2147 domain-containing protein [Acetobacter conturbans]